MKAPAYSGTNRYIYYDGAYEPSGGDYILAHATRNDVVIALKPLELPVQYHVLNVPTDEWVMVGYTLNAAQISALYFVLKILAAASAL